MTEEKIEVPGDSAKNETAPPEKQPLEKPSEAIPIPAEILKNIPPEQRERIESFISASMSFGPFPNPITHKITPQHIDKIIDLQSGITQGQFKDNEGTRKLQGFMFAVGAVLITAIVLVLSLKGQTEPLMEIIKAGGYLLGGFGGGYGYAKSRTKRR